MMKSASQGRCTFCWHFFDNYDHHSHLLYLASEAKGYSLESQVHVGVRLCFWKLPRCFTVYGLHTFSLIVQLL